MKTKKTNTKINSAVAKKQAALLYKPVTRSRSNKLNRLELEKLLHAFFESWDDIIWERTANLKINDSKQPGKYYLRCIRRERKGDTKGKRFESVGYSSAIEAENNAFRFRYELESAACKEILNDYILNLTTNEPSRTSEVKNLLPTWKRKTAESPKENPIRKKSKATLKSYKMTALSTVSAKVDRCRNPNNNPKYYNFLRSVEMKEVFAKKVQQWVSKKDIERSAKQFKKTMKDQSYRIMIVDYLSKFLSSDTSWKLILGSDDPEIATSFSTYEIQHVTIKARHIVDALRSMINATNMSMPITWIQCCENAMITNYKQIQCARTVADWYIQLHETKLLKFKRSLRGKSSAQAKSPFLENEQLTIQFKMWARADIEHLNIQKSHEFINDKLLKHWTTEQLAQNKISYPVSMHVCSRWMKEAGFKYQRHQKSYMVDRHEDPDVVEDRNGYVNQTLPDEIYEHCWIQMTRRHYLHKKLENRIQKQKLKKEASVNDIVDVERDVQKYISDQRIHEYKQNGKEMVEIHVDDWFNYNNDDEDTKQGLPFIGEFGGSLSVRLPKGEKPRIIFGQDKAIYRSSQLNENCWCIDEASPLRKKGVGQGIMVSAFQSREFGFALDINEKQLSEINKKRKDKQYEDKDASTWLMGSPEKNKAPLKESPFVRYLGYGAEKDGYWNYEHMVVQLEDCIDCVKHLYPQFDFVFELDHSSGHARERPDGLSTTNGELNFGWGGAQRKMRDTMLGTEDVGTLQHKRRIQVEQQQKMYFTDNDLPPIFDPTAAKYDTEESLEERVKLSKKELKLLLKNKGFDDTGGIKTLQRRAEDHQLCITKPNLEIIKKRN